jgi:GT2 family glycosyltransferase
VNLLINSIQTTMCPLVSVVILNYNGKNFVSQCLKSVLSNVYPNFEVLFVDNGSKDGSVALVEKLFGDDSRLEILKLGKNMGFALGNNIGIERCKGDYIMFLNNDTIVEQHYLAELVKVMEEQSDVAAVQSKLLKMDNPKLLDSAGDFVDYFGLTYNRGKGENADQYDQMDEIFSARGAAMMVKSSVLKTVGVFDPSFFMIYEDIDLCWRIRLKGYKILFSPKSIVYHFSEATTSKLNRSLPVFHGTKNWIMLMLKNRQQKGLIKFSPLIFLLCSMTMDIIKRRDIESFLARLQAIGWALRNLRQIWTKRLFVQKMLKVTSFNEDNLLVKIDLTCLTRRFLFGNSPRPVDTLGTHRERFNCYFFCH